MVWFYLIRVHFDGITALFYEDGIGHLDTLTAVNDYIIKVQCFACDAPGHTHCC